MSSRYFYGADSTKDTCIARVSAGVVEVNDGNTGTTRDMKVRTLLMTPVAVASLPSAATAGAGARAFVTDATVTLILGLGATVAGTGSNKVPVYSDGTNWIIG